MKKRMAWIMMLVLMAAMLLPMRANADVIFEPRDSFYERHREECTYVNRFFLPSGVETVKVYESPESDKVKASYSAGDRIYISYTYEDSDGILWGCCEDWDSDVSGWVAMAYLEVIYDETSFCEEHGGAFVSEEGSVATDHLGKTIRFWEYPGSQAYIEITLTTDPEGYLPEYSATYLDEAGRLWGRCSYYMGIKGHWINLDDPAADFDTLFPDNTEQTEPETPPAQETVPEIVPKAPAGTQSAKVFACVAVAAVVIVTAVLLYLLKQKK